MSISFLSVTSSHLLFQYLSMFSSFNIVNGEAHFLFRDRWCYSKLKYKRQSTRKKKKYKVQFLLTVSSHVFQQLSRIAGKATGTSKLGGMTDRLQLGIEVSQFATSLCNSMIQALIQNQLTLTKPQVQLKGIIVREKYVSVSMCPRRSECAKPTGF